MTKYPKISLFELKSFIKKDLEKIQDEDERIHYLVRLCHDVVQLQMSRRLTGYKVNLILTFFSGMLTMTFLMVLIIFLSEIFV